MTWHKISSSDSEWANEKMLLLSSFVQPLSLSLIGWKKRERSNEEASLIHPPFSHSFQPSFIHLLFSSFLSLILSLILSFILFHMNYENVRRWYKNRKENFLGMNRHHLWLQLLLFAIFVSVCVDSMTFERKRDRKREEKGEREKRERDLLPFHVLSISMSNDEWFISLLISLAAHFFFLSFFLLLSFSLFPSLIHSFGFIIYTFSIDKKNNIICVTKKTQYLILIQ